MSSLKFKIITPEREIFSKEVDQVSLMTENGEITILPNHIPLVSVLKPGELRFKTAGEEKVMAVSGGFVEVKNDNSISILADTAEIAEEINLKRAEEARDRAAKAMEQARNEEAFDFAVVQADLDRALNRIRIATKYKSLPQAKDVK